jgi:hypothetical protein
MARQLHDDPQYWSLKIGAVRSDGDYAWLAPLYLGPNQTFIADVRAHTPADAAAKAAFLGQMLLSRLAQFFGKDGRLRHDAHVFAKLFDLLDPKAPA